MDVTFIKYSPNYEVRVRRSKGPELAQRRGPGKNPRVPHDAAHMIVETEAQISGAVFGRIADACGLDGLFWPADPAERRKAGRRTRTPSPKQSADMSRSEYLASVTFAQWEVERGHRSPHAAWPVGPDVTDVNHELRQRIFVRYDEFAARWHALPEGGEITLEWGTSVRQGTRSGRALGPAR